MIAFVGTIILALFVDETDTRVLPIGEFPDHASCGAALEYLVYDAVCVEPFYLEVLPDDGDEQ